MERIAERKRTKAALKIHKYVKLQIIATQSPSQTAPAVVKTVKHTRQSKSMDWVCYSSLTKFQQFLLCASSN